MDTELTVPKRIGILAAMPQELQTFLDDMPDEHQVVMAGRTFWVGHWNGHVVIAVLSGIGKVAAAVTTSLLINRFHADEIWFTGVAGGLGEGVRVGDVVVANAFIQHDMDARPLFPRWELPGQGVTVLEGSAPLVERAVQAAQQVLGRLSRDADAAPAALSQSALQELGIGQPKVHQGMIVSGDQFVGSVAASQALREALPQALAVEMEGAAVAQVCRDFDVPCVVIRTISDRADDSAHVDFQRFIDAVASPFSHVLVQTLMAAQ